MRSPGALYNNGMGAEFETVLHARWAAVFDALGLAWEYRPETVEYITTYDMREHKRADGSPLVDFYVLELHAAFVVSPLDAGEEDVLAGCEALFDGFLSVFILSDELCLLGDSPDWRGAMRAWHGGDADEGAYTFGECSLCGTVAIGQFGQHSHCDCAGVCPCASDSERIRAAFAAGNALSLDT